MRTRSVVVPSSGSSSFSSPAASSGSVHVVVLGAGYAGVMVADHLLAAVARRPAGRPALRVTVVNPTGRFVERIRLHEVAAGGRATADRPLEDVLHPAAQLRIGRADRIDAAARTVHGDGWALPYDRLVYAVGSGAPAVPAELAGACSVADASAAGRLRADLAGRPPGTRVVVVGAGLTGIETATELAAARPDLRVSLATRGLVGPGLSAAARRRVLAALARAGVAVHPDTTVTGLVTGTAEGGLRLAGGTLLPAEVVVWAGAFAVPDLARRSGLPTDGAGRLLVDATLRVPGQPQIFGAGDAVALPDRVGGHLRMACATALPLGVCAARAVLADLDGVEAAEVSIGYLLQCVSLGRDRGVIQPVHPDDTPRSLALGGRPAAQVKEWVCRYTIGAMRAERRRAGSYRTVAAR